MFEFFKRHANRKQAAIESATETYCRLVRKAGTGGDLPDVDAAKLLAVAEELGIDQPTVEGDCAAAEQHSRISTTAAKCEGIDDAAAAASEAIADHDRETDAMLEKLKQDRATQRVGLDEKVKKARKGASVLRGLEAELEALEKRAWRVFGRPRPATVEEIKSAQAERKKQIFLTRSFNELIRQHCAAVERVDWATKKNMEQWDQKFTRAPWQTDEEFRELVSDSELFASGGRYLVKKGDLKNHPMTLNANDVVDVFEILMADQRGIKPITPFVRWPFYSAEQHGEMVAAFKSHCEKMAAEQNPKAREAMSAPKW